MNKFFEEKTICKRCKYVEGNYNYNRCQYKPQPIRTIDYVSENICYEDYCYDLNKTGECQNFLPKDFEVRLDYLLERGRRYLEVEVNSIRKQMELKNKLLGVDILDFKNHRWWEYKLRKSSENRDDYFELRNLLTEKYGDR